MQGEVAKTLAQGRLKEYKVIKWYVCARVREKEREREGHSISFSPRRKELN